MSISVFPAPVVSSLNASAITAVSANVLYEGRIAFTPAIYQITCASSTITNFQFLSDAGTIVTTGVTAGGTVSINLASNADRIRLWTDTGSNVVVTITRTAAALTNQLSGTLDTISTVGSSTYTGTSTSGWGYAILVGGGGSGGGAGGSNNGAGGGGSGGVAGKLVQLTGSMAVFIGSGGASAAAGTNGNAGTASTFAGMTAGGGAGGLVGPGDGTGGAGGTVSGATFSSSANGGRAGLPSGLATGGGATTNFYPFVVNGTTGGGGGGGGNSGNGAGGGNGAIGRGGDGGNNVAGTGFGSGGGGGDSGGRSGGAGRPGVLYVLRF